MKPIILTTLLLITACSSVPPYESVEHPAPVILHETQAELKQALRDAGHVVASNPYGFPRLRTGSGWEIHVWANNPMGLDCIVQHERKHIQNGQFVRWHEGQHGGC